MKLFELRPQKNLSKNDNPWKDMDCYYGFVIRAETECDARAFANKTSSDENIQSTKNPWLHEKYSTCRELKNDGVRWKANPL